MSTESKVHGPLEKSPHRLCWLTGGRVLSRHCGCKQQVPNSEDYNQSPTSVFINEGIPELLVSDNGTQFESAIFKEFWDENGMEYARGKTAC